MLLSSLSLLSPAFVSAASSSKLEQKELEIDACQGHGICSAAHLGLKLACRCILHILMGRTAENSDAKSHKRASARELHGVGHNHQHITSRRCVNFGERDRITAVSQLSGSYSRAHERNPENARGLPPVLALYLLRQDKEMVPAYCLLL
ncbi:uncharacterized protein [Physcomitrium patens]|uniref:uncharacterized protein isoform X8 n=1 Tax=Physcomitrium patens TaxID=3218 RepID=UPI003CCDF399